MGVMVLLTKKLLVIRLILLIKLFVKYLDISSYSTNTTLYLVREKPKHVYENLKEKENFVELQQTSEKDEVVLSRQFCKMILILFWVSFVKIQIKNLVLVT